ncbi:MAG: hypothetical protein MUF32_06540 [Burkholderiaceae bacterium]|jgi:hypothetical protein|nr:hypothetical protein [Burkholderiaceae bacterium]
MPTCGFRPLLAPIAALLLLAGCATPGPALVGADRATVQTKVGAPPERFPLPGGGERWLYPWGGLQQRVDAVDFDAAGRVVAVTQVRTAENFARVRVGVDTQADIRREFGPPRIVVPFPRIGLVAWMFPFLENDFWRSEMAIYFDAQGIVRRVESGPDPRFLNDGDRR